MNLPAALDFPVPSSAAPDAAIPDKRPRGRPRKTADEREDGNRRQALLQSAAQLFRRKGFGATS
ncbi:MAG TPA: TetR/AcrR family transcriptional regulator, partial [Burkholderiaceae bacterium]